MSRELAGRVGLVLLLWLLGGRVGLFIGLAIAFLDLFLQPSPKLLLRASLLGFCLLPLAVVIRGLPRPSTVTPLFAGSNLVAHYLAGTALALLVLGILRDVRPAPLPRGPGNGPPPNGYELPAPLPSPPVQERLPAPGAAGNGAPREAQPALPSATHPPLWDPARRRPGAAALPPEEAPPVHPPLWDPSRRRPTPGVAPADGPAGPPAGPPEEAPQEVPPTHPPLRAPAHAARPPGQPEPPGPPEPPGQPEPSGQPEHDNLHEPVGPRRGDPFADPAMQRSERTGDRPDSAGRRHPPELRIAGEPIWTEAARAEAAAQEGERVPERERGGGSRAPSDRGEDEDPPTPEREQGPER